MKKSIIILFGMLIAFSSQTQTGGLPDYLSNLVAPLDKSEIESEYLWDKGLNGFAEPAIFDGILRDSVYVQPITFGFLYTQARNSYVGTGNNLSCRGW